MELLLNHSTRVTIDRTSVYRYSRVQPSDKNNDNQWGSRSCLICTQLLYSDAVAVHPLHPTVHAHLPLTATIHAHLFTATIHAPALSLPTSSLCTPHAHLFTATLHPTCVRSCNSVRNSVRHQVVSHRIVHLNLVPSYGRACHCLQHCLIWLATRDTFYVSTGVVPVSLCTS